MFFKCLIFFDGTVFGAGVAFVCGQRYFGVNDEVFIIGKENDRIWFNGFVNLIFGYELGFVFHAFFES